MFHSYQVCPYCLNRQYFNSPSYNPYYGFQYQNWYYNRNPEKMVAKAAWTWGGKVSKCEIPWSHNHYMTVAVPENSGLKCGQKLLVKNLTFLPQKEVIVTVVDEVKKSPGNRIILHRHAFEALGVPPTAGVIDSEITVIE